MNMEEYPEWQYSPLTQDGHVRLLRIDQLCAADEHFGCDVAHVDRYDLPRHLKYIAISYRWGDENDKVAIRMRQCGIDRKGRLSRATGSCVGRKWLPRSTAEMLMDLYHNGWIQDRWIWLDFLCLNQEDFAEKGVQVALMGDVYKLCAKCYVYAGPETSTTARAIAFWERLQTFFFDSVVAGLEELIPHETMFAATGTSMDDLDWKALRELLTRPWFGRLWVMQEVVLPASVRFIWGSFSLHWDELRQFHDWHELMGRGIVDTVASNVSEYSSIAIVNSIDYLRKGRLGGNNSDGCDLFEALVACQTTISTDPRDRIYGVLGMLHGVGTDLKLVPDYGPASTVRRVYTDYTAMYTQAYELYDLVERAGIGVHESIPDLPSWVPDLSQALVHSIRSDDHHIQAGKGPSAVKVPFPDIIGEDLYATLFFIDSVQSVQSFENVLKDGDQSIAIDESPWLQSFIQSAIRVVLARYTAPWSEELFEAFARTLVTNSSTSSRVVDACANLDLVKNFGITNSTAVSTPDELSKFLADTCARSGIGAIGLTAKGRPVQLPRFAEVGDVLAVAAGARVPFVLRSDTRTENNVAAYRLVGTGYVHAWNEGIHIAETEGELRNVIVR